MTVRTAVRHADRHVADPRLPSFITDTNIWLDSLAMLARRVAHWDVACPAGVAVEAVALIRRRTDAINATCTLAQVADVALPALVAETQVRVNASTVHAIGPADRSRAIDPCPAVEALAALPVVLVVINEALEEEIQAADQHRFCSFDDWIVKDILFFLIVAVIFVEFVL